MLRQYRCPTSELTGHDDYKRLLPSVNLSPPDIMFTEPPVEVIIKDGSSRRVIGKLEVQITDGDADKWAWESGAFCGTPGRFIAATNDTPQAFDIPSGKKIADLPLTTWQDVDAMTTDPTVTVFAV